LACSHCEIPVCLNSCPTASYCFFNFFLPVNNIGSFQVP
jgi:hypothetical protein